jgi:hypothetical protein
VSSLTGLWLIGGLPAARGMMGRAPGRAALSGRRDKWTRVMRNKQNVFVRSEAGCLLHGWRPRPSFQNPEIAASLSRSNLLAMVVAPEA